MKTNVRTQHGFYLEAVSVCVDYDDFLSAVIPYNLPIFDRWVIVTSSKDEDTRELCRKYGLETILADEALTDNEFNKGWMIERGLQALSMNAWRIHIDADMVLPAHTRRLLMASDLNTDTIYGADRIMVRSWDDWQKLINLKWLEGGQHVYSHAITIPDGYALGSRWAAPHMGYVPIGAFQMFHSDADEWKGTRIRKYPHRHNTAARTDIQFGLQWDKNKRALIPELLVAHLESEPAKLGANWKGRTTVRFGPHHPKKPHKHHHPYC
jgi:hypothetical protein